MVLVASFGLFCVAACGPIDYHQHPHGDDGEHDDDEQEEDDRVDDRNDECVGDMNIV